jgi:RHS repeat-associated protein
MAQPLVITQPGYVYLYLSNENPTPVDVYFDDFTVTHSKSPVVQGEEYYPFGLTFNSFQRENSVSNLKQFNGIEKQDELELGWYMAELRTYDPTIGRWFQLDPKLSERESPYAGFGNNPIKFSDILGDTVKYSGRDKEVQQMKDNDEELKKARRGRRILNRLEESENVHETKGVPRGGKEDPEGREIRVEEQNKFEKEEISETERDEFMKAGAATASDSDIRSFRGQGYDGKDSDGTGTGSTMYWGDHSGSPGNGIATFGHERIHQSNADRGKISKKVRNGRLVEEMRTQRQTNGLIRQYNRVTGSKIPVSRKY